ncbi:MAG TPA: ABC transporter substrate-binding protein [Paenibacillus sp.]|nr:ABC transporter substrate-binding protein [Paenibacillus sp.]
MPVMEHRKRRTLLAGGLAITLALTGCLQGGGAADPGAEEPPPTIPYDPPVVVTTSRVLNDTDPSKLIPPDTIDDNPITRWAKERFGIIQNSMWVLADEDALEHKLKLALTGDEPIPDVLYLNDEVLPQVLEDIADSGRFMSIEESFEAYASPRMKEAFAKNPDVWKTVTSGGKRWGLPQISDGKIGDPILWIRQDWLDALGLAPPKTIAELETILEAFTNGDPDGNGKKDTVGFALSGKDSLNAWLADASFVFGAYGDQPYQWNRMPDGRLAYGSVQPGMKKALAKLQSWYAQGWLHPNFGTHDELTAANLFVEGEAGVLSGPGWMGGWPLGEVGEDEHGKKPGYRPIPFPAGEDGKIGRRGSKLSYGSYVFRKDFPYMEAMFQYWDEVFATFVEDPESDFLHGFGENYDYKIENGKVIYDFKGATTTIAFYLLIAPGSVPPGMLDESLESRVYRGKVESPYEKRLAETTGSRLFLEGIVVGDKQLAYAQKDQFLGVPTETMRTKWPALKKLEKETFLKIVYGNESVDAFDAFVQSWRSSGGDDITREVNAWADTIE